MAGKISGKIVFLTILVLMVGYSFAGIKKHFAIDVSKCTFDNCDECVYECAEEAITKTKIDGKEVLVVDAEKCTNCEICIEICEEDAIYIDSTDVPGYDPAKDPLAGLSKEELQQRAREKQEEREE